ncbi:MAG: GNAT family N-acetyltransferase [Oceanospirillaceae bacterium]|nr:GNAT family N-acetyltransferase [Oceanospirillaceae bacterium]MCP5351005.1 GNAT family N-acetyltransferase [Oceanospirillaceae bacterium]
MALQEFSSFQQTDTQLWQQQLGDFPFLQPAFLQALEDNACFGHGSGWQPHYLQQGNSQIAAFIKMHSYGEYVFDFAWADAYARYGYVYYPKLIIAAPFTPVPGPRVLGEQNPQLWQALAEHCRQKGFSSAHVQFCEEDLIKQLPADWLIREGVQFHWFNRAYQDFNHYLDHFVARKRKNTLKERRGIQEMGINILRKSGVELTPADWHSFYLCYHNTHARRGRTGYLTEGFFRQIGQQMPGQILMLQAQYQGQIIACALFFHDKDALYGRYWGALTDVNNLHFELCYYQGIEFCIENKLRLFNPGTQGEHKIARGFEPVTTYSAHYIAEPAFARAIGDFIQQEKHELAQYRAEAALLLPFHRNTER